MIRPNIRKLIFVISAFFAVWLGLRYLLPVSLPFLLGGGLALGAEPLVRFLCDKLKLRRGVAAGIGVSIAFALLVLALMLLGALAVKQIKNLSSVLPQAQQMIQTSLVSTQDLLLSLSQRMPENISLFLTQTVTDLFSGSAALLSKVTDKLLALATGFLGRIPNGALGFGTGIVSSYMISAKLPKIKLWLLRRIPRQRRRALLETWTRIKKTAASWLMAQCKLMGVTFVLLLLGLVLLKIPYALLWALGICLVDALPVLGTGTVLIPWSLVLFLQEDAPRAIGLLGLYATISLIRSALEPKFLGRHLGLDPLVTLIALYAGYKLWGIAGMLFAPLLTVTAMQLVSETR